VIISQYVLQDHLNIQKVKNKNEEHKAITYISFKTFDEVTFRNELSFATFYIIKSITDPNVSIQYY
jgi:hypothetical protein